MPDISGKVFIVFQSNLTLVAWMTLQKQNTNISVQKFLESKTVAEYLAFGDENLQIEKKLYFKFKIYC